MHLDAGMSYRVALQRMHLKCRMEFRTSATFIDSHFALYQHLLSFLS